jgi:predicted small lipoprotein YifL
MNAARLTTLTLFAAAALALAGCGKVGDLERPAPIGAPDANQPSKPKSTGERADPASSTGTIPESPLPNAPQDPFGRSNPNPQ